MTVGGGKSPKIGENLFRRQVIQQESHTKSLETEIGYPQ
jgi:hypothetical protein